MKRLCKKQTWDYRGPQRFCYGFPLAITLLLSSFSIYPTVVAHAETLFPWMPPLLCEYHPDHHIVVCDVNKEGLRITAAKLNGGICKIPVISASSLVKSSSDRSFFEINHISVRNDFRKTYEDGERFVIPVDQSCQLTSYSVIADDKEWSFDHAPQPPVLYKH